MIVIISQQNLCPYVADFPRTRSRAVHSEDHFGTVTGFVINFEMQTDFGKSQFFFYFAIIMEQAMYLIIPLTLIATFNIGLKSVVLFS